MFRVEEVALPRRAPPVVQSQKGAQAEHQRMVLRYLLQIVVDAQEAGPLPQNLDVVVQRPEIPVPEHKQAVLPGPVRQDTDFMPSSFCRRLQKGVSEQNVQRQIVAGAETVTPRLSKLILEQTFQAKQKIAIVSLRGVGRHEPRRCRRPPAGAA